MKRSRDGNAAHGYPSILDLALRAGKWSLVAGGSAAIMGSTACGPVPTAGVLELDGQYWVDSSLDTGDAAGPRDVAVIDTGLFADPGNVDSVIQDVAPADAGAFADEWVESDPGHDIESDVQDTDDGIDQGPTAGVPYQEDGMDRDDSVQDPVDARDVQE